MSQLNRLKNGLPLRVLFVEDNEDDFYLVVDYLQQQDIVVDAKRVCTRESLLCALKESWDVVLSDYTMPNFSGIGALSMVREKEIDLPFIFVSGTIGEEAAVQAIKDGAQDYVIKTHLKRLVPTLERELRDVVLRKEKKRTEDHLRKLSMAINQAADSVFICDSEGYIEYVNPSFELMTGYKSAEVIGGKPSVLRSDHHSKSDFECLWNTLKKGQVYSGTIVNRRKDGALFYEEKVITPMLDYQGKITHYVSTGRDITERIEAERVRERLATTLAITPDLVAIISPRDEILYLNKAGFQFLQIAEDVDIQRCKFPKIFPDPLKTQFNAQISAYVCQYGSWSGESALRLDDVERPVSLVVLGHRHNAGEVIYYSLIARDLTERKQFEAELQLRATHDNLTGLPNRYYLMDHLKTALRVAQRKKKRVALLFLDMDKFKRINDSLGHNAGDQLLKSVAKAFCSCLRPGDTVARLGGDEFTIIVEDVEKVDDVIVVLSKLYRIFETPFFVESQELFVTFSTGIAIFPQDGLNEQDLLRHADMAMYRAKAMGANQYYFYAPGMNSRGREILEMETQLKYALENNEFTIFYQPQIDILSGQVVGVEALIRWNHATLGIVPPAEFVPILESSGLINSVGEWVIREACCQHQRLSDAGYASIRISVNVSPVQFRNPRFKDLVIAIVLENKLPQQILEIEITENIVMEDPIRTAKVLQEMRNVGLRSAIDDFGTGYSSLAYLKRFPFNTLKIDQTFIRDVLVDSNDAAIVEASISLAHKLGLEVIAEGVETSEQMEFLRARHCNQVQGYWIARPEPHQGLLPLLESKPWLSDAQTVAV